MERKREPYVKFKRFLSINHIKQKELAEKLGKSSSCVNSVLNGRGADFTTEDFRMIRCVFNIKIQEYF
ncbi:helix-turn-helix transcriptional regulator [uncultured Clostridium sp.]|uniref:helix-turn-helix transcriptional regulator n=1 Tax=uncultured Clostridium sp. TaxID=59620 RepID=UPI0028E60613|nr:helix-turn-helix transcriptional regulator [uncultured Clostridium sp.]